MSGWRRLLCLQLSSLHLDLSICSGFSSVPLFSYYLGPEDVTVFGNRVFVDVMKIKRLEVSSHGLRVRPKFHESILRQDRGDT